MNMSKENKNENLKHIAIQQLLYFLTLQKGQKKYENNEKYLNSLKEIFKLFFEIEHFDNIPISHFNPNIEISSRKLILYYCLNKEKYIGDDEYQIFYVAAKDISRNIVDKLENVSYIFPEKFKNLIINDIQSSELIKILPDDQEANFYDSVNIGENFE
jgi:hypothetical protein